VVSGRPVAIVLGAAADDQPPGIGRAADVCDLRYARDADELASTIGEAEAAFFWRASRSWLESAWPKASNLRWIQTASDGVDGLLFPALAHREGLVVTNARGVFDEPIAEWVIAVMLAIASGLHTSIVEQPARRWSEGRHRGRLAGAHLVVVGPGPIGRATARRARALGMSVMGVGRAARSDGVFESIVGPDDFHTALADGDYVLDALPLTAKTRHLFNAAAFAAMKPTAHFINVGRGPTVDESALIDALRAGRIAGAALDVFETEPLPESSPLWTLPGVIVSPHICGDVAGWERAVVDVFVDNAGRFARGEPLRNRVDVRLGFGMDDGSDPGTVSNVNVAQK
jgi:phosphoglycerate dehydrogenase-like enzyme